MQFLLKLVWDTPRKCFGNLGGKAEDNLNWEINLYVRVCLYSVRIPVHVVFGFAVDISEVFLWGVPEEVL